MPCVITFSEPARESILPRSFLHQAQILFIFYLTSTSVPRGPAGHDLELI
jgi:hypothetical protein